jgi:hypothetical protein
LSFFHNMNIFSFGFVIGAEEHKLLSDVLEFKLYTFMIMIVVCCVVYWIGNQMCNLLLTVECMGSFFASFTFSIKSAFTRGIIHILIKLQFIFMYSLHKIDLLETICTVPLHINVVRQLIC